MNKKKIAVMAALLLPAFLVIAFVAYTNALLNKVVHDTEPVADSELGISNHAALKPGEKREEVENIALFGLDYEFGDHGRSDTILILSMDKPHNMIKFTSIMRDSYVSIDGYGKDKINHAYAFGGPQLAMKTLNENFQLDIKKYVTVNFSDLTAIIDKLGGVEMSISDEEAAQISGLEKGGTYQLTGSQALTFSRIRCLKGGDYERTLRQRKLIEKLYSTLITKPATQYPSIAGALMPLIKTNLTNNEIITISTYIAAAKPNIAHTRFPEDDAASGRKINGVYYLVFQEQETVDAIHHFIYDTSS